MTENNPTINQRDEEANPKPDGHIDQIGGQTPKRPGDPILEADVFRRNNLDPRVERLVFPTHAPIINQIRQVRKAFRDGFTAHKTLLISGIFINKSLLKLVKVMVFKP